MVNSKLMMCEKESGVTIQRPMDHRVLILTLMICVAEIFMVVGVAVHLTVKIHAKVGAPPLVAHAGRMKT